jgi:hypothetical protein
VDKRQLHLAVLLKLSAEKPRSVDTAAITMCLHKHTLTACAVTVHSEQIDIQITSLYEEAEFA